MKILQILIRLLLGSIYLILGVAKAADINGFGDIIVQYGFPKLYLLAPVITSIEMVLAFGLLLSWRVRKVALFSLGFINSLSIIFLIGHFFMGIEDCGCLGSFYEFPIWLSILRNIFMVFASYWLYKNAIHFGTNRFEIVKLIVVISFGLVTLFITAFEMKVSYREVSYTRGDRIKNTFLAHFSQNSEKGILVFIFSPNCVHCRNITPKLNELLHQAEYDEIVGLYPKEIPETLVNEYIKKLNLTFQIIPIPYDSLSKIAKVLPLFLILKNGKIEKVMKDI